VAKQRKRDRKHVVFVLPTYTGEIHVGTSATVYGEGMALQARGHRFSVMDDVGSADISFSRALAVAKFMDSPGTHLMFVDADISGPPGCVQRLLEYDVDFIAGVYVKRQEPFQFLMNYLDGCSGPRLDTETGLLEVRHVAGGFVCVTRRMLAKMLAKHADLEFICPPAPLGRAVSLFEHYWYTDQNGRHRFGEDYAFCERWRDMGGKVLVDPEITLGHTGHKRYTARLLDYLQPKEEACQQTTQQVA